MQNYCGHGSPPSLRTEKQPLRQGRTTMVPYGSRGESDYLFSEITAVQRQQNDIHALVVGGTLPGSRNQRRMPGALDPFFFVQVPTDRKRRLGYRNVGRAAYATIPWSLCLPRQCLLLNPTTRFKESNCTRFLLFPFLPSPPLFP